MMYISLPYMPGTFRSLPDPSQHSWTRNTCDGHNYSHSDRLPGSWKPPELQNALCKPCRIASPSLKFYRFATVFACVLMLIRTMSSCFKCLLWNYIFCLMNAQNIYESCSIVVWMYCKITTETIYYHYNFNCLFNPVILISAATNNCLYRIQDYLKCL